MLRFLTLILLLTATLPLYGEAANKKPNVIILFIDDLGYGDVGAFGCEDIPTPHMDTLAKQGVMCTQSYITNPPCCPSRCSLMMGMYGQRFGKYGMSRGLAIPEDKPTLAEFMRDHGYVTGQIGKWDIGSSAQLPMTQGFSEVAMWAPPKDDYKFIYVKKDGSDGWRTAYDGDKMIEFVERNQDNPFFLYFSPQAVHSPSKETPEHYRKRTTAIKKRRALAGAIVAVDDQVGRLLACLKKLNLEKNTLIFLTGDNGPNLHENGSSRPYRGGKGKGTQGNGWVLTPAIISYPGLLPADSRFDGMMCTLDFYATIAALISKKSPAHLDGKNLVPFLQGDRQGDVHEYLYWQNTDPNDAKRRRLVAARWQNWRLYQDRETNQWQLFDLNNDKREQHDVSSQFPEVVSNMSKQHAKWVETLAPMITGKQAATANKKDKKMSQKKGDKKKQKNEDASTNHKGVPHGYDWVYTK